LLCARRKNNDAKIIFGSSVRIFSLSAVCCHVSRHTHLLPLHKNKRARAPRMLLLGRTASSSSSSSSSFFPFPRPHPLGTRRRNLSSSSSSSSSSSFTSSPSEKASTQKNARTKKKITMATGAASNAPSSEKERITNASCYCGKVQMEVRGLPVAVSICHCTICRRLSGGVYSQQSLHSQKNFTCEATENDLWSIQTSPNVTRYRCKECGSPVYAKLGKGKTYVVPRSALINIAKDDKSFAPTHHMHYKQRVVNVEDDLPKFVGTSTPGRAEAWNPSLD
jgi:hypothetical protein